MTRTTQILSFVTIILTSTILQAADVPAQEPAPSRPNILFILSDDHALRTISAYAGDTAINQTPNIDRIAREGAIFPNSFCENSICIPSRATIITGKTSNMNRMYTNYSKWDGSQEVFPRLLEQAGYQTALIGKWHIKPLPTNEFQYWKVLTDNGGQGFYYNPSYQVKGASAPEVDPGFEADITVKDSTDWLDRRDKSKPFLLMSQFKEPHVHRLPAIRTLHMYTDVNFPLPTNFFDDYKFRNSYAGKVWMKIATIPDAELNIFPPLGTDANALLWDRSRQKGPKEFSYLDRLTPEQLQAFHEAYDPQNREFFRLRAAGKLNGVELAKYKYQRYMRDYMRCVAGLDQSVGKLLDYLDKNGLAKNTIVIYSSDQGFFLGEHGWAEKRWMYEEALHMPFVIRWPAEIAPGQIPKEMIQNIDYAPTLLAAAGVPIPPEIQGRSFLPILEGKTPSDWRKDIYYHYYEDGDYNMPRLEGVRDDRYKLIRYYMPDKPGNEWELFDLQKDPREMHSVYGEPAYAPQVTRLMARLEVLKKQYRVPDQDPPDIKSGGSLKRAHDAKKGGASPDSD